MERQKKFLTLEDIAKAFRFSKPSYLANTLSTKALDRAWLGSLNEVGRLAIRKYPQMNLHSFYIACGVTADEKRKESR